MYPALFLNKEKLIHNVKTVKNLCDTANIELFAVTKCFCSNPDVIDLYYKGGVRVFADSRISNLQKYDYSDIKKVLIRIPMLSEVEKVVEVADISLNSEIEVIRKLSEEALKQNKVHEIILMIELGDLREGIVEESIESIVENVKDLKGVNLVGFGTNLTCYGAIIPDDNNLGKLVELSKNLNEKYNLNIKYISGGNSSSVYKLLDGTLSKDINNLRIGEFILFGTETAYGEDYTEIHQDVFTLKTEIIELKVKDSLPTGNSGVNAFGKKPTFEDKGKMKRAIIAIGKQDVSIDNILPKDESIFVVGQSSDHTILDLTQCKTEYKVGDILEFKVEYTTLLEASTSEYVSTILE